MRAKHFSQSHELQLKSWLECPTNLSTDSLVVEMLYRTGMRQGELVRLTAMDFDFPRRMIRVRPLKGSKERRLPIPESCIARYQAFVESWGTGTLGTAISSSKDVAAHLRLVRKIVARVFDASLNGNQGYSAHCLRHTFALKCLRAFDNDVLKVQMAMGHKSLSSTARYLDYLKSEDLSEVILKLVS